MDHQRASNDASSEGVYRQAAQDSAERQAKMEDSATVNVRNRFDEVMEIVKGHCRDSRQQLLNQFERTKSGHITLPSFQRAVRTLFIVASLMWNHEVKAVIVVNHTRACMRMGISAHSNDFCTHVF
jgi:hypothetical protein